MKWVDYITNRSDSAFLVVNFLILFVLTLISDLAFFTLLGATSMDKAPLVLKVAIYVIAPASSLVFLAGLYGFSNKTFAPKALRYQFFFFMIAGFLILLLGWVMIIWVDEKGIAWEPGVFTLFALYSLIGFRKYADLILFKERFTILQDNFRLVLAIYMGAWLLTEALLIYKADEVYILYN